MSVVYGSFILERVSYLGNITWFFRLLFKIAKAQSLHFIENQISNAENSKY